MYIIVAGGGKVGYYLAKTLVNEGHEVLVIEQDARKCSQIADELGNIVLRGDAAEARILAEAGTSRADVVIAVTGDDEDNLVICQLAKKRFSVPRTIARINNPKNEESQLPASCLGGHPDLISHHRRRSRPGLVHLLIPNARRRGPRGGGDPEDYNGGWQTLREFVLPPDCTISLICATATCDSHRGDNRLHVGDGCSPSRIPRRGEAAGLPDREQTPGSSGC